MHHVRESGGDRPKPGCFARRGVGPHNAADLAAIVVEYHEVVILAKPSWFERQHGASIAANARVGRLDHIYRDKGTVWLVSFRRGD
jgi:hypothetical protein